MGKISSLSQLNTPSWFNKSRYKRLRKSTLEQLELELNLRSSAMLAIQNDIPIESDVMELFDNYPQEVQLHDNYDTRESSHIIDENVKALSCLDVISINEQIKQKQISPFNDVHESIGQSVSGIDGKGLFVGISLSLATNQEIHEELERLINKSRGILKIKEPVRYRLNEKYDNLFRRFVFQYLDITIWASINGHDIKRSYIREAIDSLSYSKVTPTEISGTIKENAEHAISFEFLEQLRHTIKDSKKVRNFNPT
jgi:hypothetical protein